jgi:hypothetical protein
MSFTSSGLSPFHAGVRVFYVPVFMFACPDAFSHLHHASVCAVCSCHVRVVSAGAQWAIKSDNLRHGCRF